MTGNADVDALALLPHEFDIIYRTNVWARSVLDLIKHFGWTRFALTVVEEHETSFLNIRGTPIFGIFWVDFSPFLVLAWCCLVARAIEEMSAKENVTIELFEVLANGNDLVNFLELQEASKTRVTVLIAGPRMVHQYLYSSRHVFHHPTGLPISPLSSDWFV